ncbi:hypothetical protein EON66_11765 [archaeon]|nr:MAG: hypothetical protein EON66_11765 [archaeon]
MRTAPEAPWRDDGDDCEADARCAVELQNAGTPSTSATAAGVVVLDSVAASSGTIAAAAQSCAPVMGTASEVLAVQGDLFVPPAGPQLAVSADNLTAQPLYGIHKWHCTWGASSIDAGSAYVCSPSTTSAPPVVTALRAQGATQGVYVPSTSSNAAAAVSLQARAYPVYVPPRFEPTAVMHASRAEGKQGEEEETGDEFQVQALKSRLAARLACAHW